MHSRRPCLGRVAQLKRKSKSLPPPLAFRREGKSSSVKAHSGAVRCVTFSKDGRYLLSCSDDKTLKARPLCILIYRRLLLRPKSQQVLLDLLSSVGSCRAFGSLFCKLVLIVSFCDRGVGLDSANTAFQP